MENSQPTGPLLARQPQSPLSDGPSDSAPPNRNFLRFTNCRTLPQDSECDRLVTSSDLLVDLDQGTIAAIVGREEKRNEHLPRPGDNVGLVDCKGNILSPGFIDLQLNGAYGVDFSDDKITAEDVSSVARKLPSTGVTSFSPTLISCSREEYRKIIPVIGPLCLCHKDNCDRNVGGRSRRNDSEIGGSGDDHNTFGAIPLGMHLEGPFFAPSKHGAHPLVHIVDPSDGFDSVSQVYGTSPNLLRDCGISIVTLAPEREGALSVVQGLAQRGVVVSMGHTDAKLEEGRAGLRHGATLITHLFNAMKPFHHREPALLGLLPDSNGTDEEATTTATAPALGRSTRLDGKQKPHFSLIADGIHVHPIAIRLARSVHPSGVVLITDAIGAMGLGDGTYTLGDTNVEVSGMQCMVAGSDTLAGSVAPMDFCVRSYKEFAGCSVAEALRAATVNPAKVFGCDGVRGKLAPDYAADLVLLDEQLNVVGTWVGGRHVYDRSSAIGVKRKRE